MWKRVCGFGIGQDPVFIKLQNPVKGTTPISPQREKIMPVHHDDEYRVKLEKQELLKLLGIGMDSEEYRRVSISSAYGRDDPDTKSRIVSGKTDSLKKGVGTNMLALLRVIVLQNELVLIALKRLEEALSERPKPFNPADWK
jgi:hypothetical protein